jgi:ribonuclease HI
VLGEEDLDNWVAYFDATQSREGLGAGVYLVSPTGQHLKYVVQLAFSQEDCASSTSECEGLLAGLRIAMGLGVTHLAIRGDSQLTVGQADGAGMSLLMRAYTCEM